MLSLPNILTLSRIFAVPLLAFSMAAMLRTDHRAAVLWALLFATGQWRRMERRLAGSFALMGLLNNLIPFSLIFWGQTQIPIGLASILNATTPVFTIIVVHLLTADEKATPNKVAGVLAETLLGMWRAKHRAERRGEPWPPPEPPSAPSLTPDPPLPPLSESSAPREPSLALTVSSASNV